MRVRRRLGISIVLALAIAIIGGGPLAHDPRISKLVTRDKSRVGVDAATQNMALAPNGPVSSDGEVDGLVPVAAQPSTQASRRSQEAVIKTAPQQFEGPAPQRVAPPAAINEAPVASQAASTGTWAVVIGVNDYPGSQNDLISAVNDANDMVQALNNFGVESDHILPLRDGQVTRNTLLDSVTWLANHAGPDATAIFFYAGHVRKTTAGNEEIVASDGSSVTDGQLASALSRVQANRSWVAIAACYGGGFTEVLRPGRVLTGAADKNSLAYENATIGRSYMVEYMIRRAMIQNRASATVQTAFNFAVDNISRDKPGREPVQFDSGDGALNLRPPHSTQRPAPDPTPSQPQTTTTLPAKDRPGTNQKCTGSGLFRMCTNG